LDGTAAVGAGAVKVAGLAEEIVSVGVVDGLVEASVSVGEVAPDERVI
jgi:hypothetical protein